MVDRKNVPSAVFVVLTKIHFNFFLLSLKDQTNISIKFNPIGYISIYSYSTKQINFYLKPVIVI